MHVFRPDSAALAWSVDVDATDAAQVMSALPYTTTLSSITTQTNYAIAIFLLFIKDDNTQDEATAGWTEFTPSQVRNNTTTDQACNGAFKTLDTAGATGDLEIVESANDAGHSITFAFKES